MPVRTTTASQTIGPFFHDGLDHPAWSDLTAGGALGQKIRIEGRVLDGDGQPIGDAMIEIWQANAAGRYDHPEDSQAKPLDPNFRGFGRVGTAKDGFYRFTTIRPGPVPGRGNAMQAPHINVTIFARGLLKRLVTRVYFADEPANAADPVLGTIEDPSLRRTLMAEASVAKSGSLPIYRFDIVLQGKGETVFFDV
ncbi:MAG: protocatechuate 3,4-dioxygenase subunit alpha [Alphaproteobacteria bacterium]|nr:protocatechuate 3,4-dioxygenase subunit alpha [Alphaproteobacteria bacterium]